MIAKAKRTLLVGVALSILLLLAFLETDLLIVSVGLTTIAALKSIVRS